MIGPLQQRLLRMMEINRGVTASELHKALIRERGDKSQSYSTVLSVLRNLAKRRPDLLASEKTKQQLVFTLRVPVETIYAAEFSAFVNSMGWDGRSLAFLKAVSRLPSVSTAMKSTIAKEIAEQK